MAEAAAGTDAMSVDQIQLSLSHLKTLAAEKLSSNDRLGNLRRQLWQKHILSRDEFVLLGEISDAEGPLGMAQKLIDLMLKKKDQLHKFLQEVQILDPEVFGLVRDAQQRADEGGEEGAKKKKKKKKKKKNKKKAEVEAEVDSAKQETVLKSDGEPSVKTQKPVESTDDTQGAEGGGEEGAKKKKKKKKKNKKKGTGDISTEEQAAGTEALSVDQIHLSLLYVRSEAAEKLRSNGTLNDLRSQLWQKNILSRKEFALLGETWDKDGTSGMANKLIDLMLEKKEQHQKFLQEIWTVDPDVHALITENLDIVQKISDHIRTTYKKRSCHLVQVLPGEKLHLDLHRAEYVMPLVISAERLVRQERQGHMLPRSEVKHEYEKLRCKNVEEIVNTMSRGSETVVLCLGIAGVGKTICTKKIVTGWVDGEEMLQGYNIVLAIPVRDVNVKASIIDMIGGEQSSLGLVPDSMKEILDFCLTEEVYASKVTVLIDGIDECDISAGTELYQFITGRKYPHVKKLITARPEAALLSDLKSFYPDYKVTIQGTSEKGVYRYLREVMAKDSSTPSHDEIDSLILKCQKEMVNFDLLLIPLYSTMIGYLFNSHWAQYCTFTNFTVPKSTTRLFSSFLNMLIRIWLKKIGKKTEAENIRFHINAISPESNVPNHIKRILDSFGKISYDLIQQQKYTMTEADLDKYHIDVEDIKQSGMFCMGQERGQMLCFFRHKTLQEFMAALYLSHIGFSEQTFTADIDSAVQSQEGKTLLEVFPKLHIVLKFLFGLDSELCCKIIDKLSGHVCVGEYLEIDLDYEASLLCEVEDAGLSRAYVELVSKTSIKRKHGSPKTEPVVSNLCRAFSPEQRIRVLESWYGLHVYQQGQEWRISDVHQQGQEWRISRGGENTGSCSEPTDKLYIEYFTELHYLFLQQYEFHHIQSLELEGSVTSHVGFLQGIFPQLKAININGLHGEKSITELLILIRPETQHPNAAALVSSGSTNTPETQHPNAAALVSSGSTNTPETQHPNAAALVSSGSTNTPETQHPNAAALVSSCSINLHSIVINAGGISSLPVSSVESLTQQAGLQSLTLCELREFPPLWDVDRGLVSWNNLTVLEINAHKLDHEKEFWEFLQNYTPKLTALTISTFSDSDSTALIQQALCTLPLSQLTTLRLFALLDSKGVLALCESLPPGLHTLGVGWREVRKVMDTLCVHCPQVKHLHVGYWDFSDYNKSDAVSVCRDLISHRAAHHADSPIQVGLYNYETLEYEPENTLFPPSLVNPEASPPS